MTDTADRSVKLVVVRTPRSTQFSGCAVKVHREDGEVEVSRVSGWKLDDVLAELRRRYPNADIREE